MADWPQSVATMLMLSGVNPKRIKTNYILGDDPDKPDGRAVIAIPDIEVAITTDRDIPDGFNESGWIVIPVSVKEFQDFHAVFQKLMTVYQANQRSKTLDTDSNTSRHEQWLIDECLRRNLPRPERNLDIEDPDKPGRKLTVPDLAWEKYKVSFFVDGLWWHNQQENDKRMKILDADLTDDEKKRRMEKEKSLLEKDARIRSKMQVLGWVTLNCSDRDLERPGGIREQVDRIERVLTTKKKEQEALSAIEGLSAEDMDKLRGLL